MDFFNRASQIRRGYGFCPDIIKHLPEDGCLLLFNVGIGTIKSLRLQPNVRVSKGPQRKLNTFVRDGYSETQFVSDVYITRK